MSSIAERIDQLQREIAAICRKAGRAEGSCRLIAVSKNFSVDIIREAVLAGQRLFGENRVQELKEKIPLLPPELEWHLIGTLQRNKVKYIVDKTALIHSVDSLALAEEISKRARQKGVVAKILLQVNISREESKSGFSPGELLAQLEEICRLPGIKIRGLMTMAPLGEDPEEARPHFRKLCLLAEEIKGLALPNVEMAELSMGMSDDYQVAVEEGATLVRIGSKIFGARKY